MYVYVLGHCHCGGFKLMGRHITRGQRCNKYRLEEEEQMDTSDNCFNIQHQREMQGGYMSNNMRRNNEILSMRGINR